MSDSSSPNTQAVVKPMRQTIYMRRARDGAKIDGETSGWLLEPALLCEQVTIQAGAAIGTADFLVVPQPPEVDIPAGSRAIEDLAAQYSTDDQVRVVIEPNDDPGNGGGVFVLFEGVLSRQIARISSQDSERAEGMKLVAFPMPLALDGHHPDHLIRGRWISDLRTNARPTNIGYTRDVYVVESPVLPATFNFRGRPNKHNTIKVRCGSEDKQIESAVFTHENDPEGQYWSVGDAIAAIVAVWGYGATDSPLKRNFDIESETLEALKDPGAVEEDGRWRGFSEILPEMTVQGMGIWEALEAVCKASDFDFAIVPAPSADAPEMEPSLPPDEPPPQDGAKYDRRYILTVWRKGEGEIAWFDLDKREGDDQGAEEFAAKNTLRTLETMRDAHELANVIYGVGRELYEVRLDLKPLWFHADLDPTKPLQAQLDPDETDLAAPGTYAARHCAGGVDFDDFGHVGRRWGIHCTGIQVYYDTGYYASPATGFDWVHELDLRALDKAPSKWRSDRKILDLIKWTKRVRPLLPLRSHEAKRLGVEYYLEISENFGTDGTWKPAPKTLQFAALRETACGIYLSVKNLCAVNFEMLSTGDAVQDVETSWWNLIRLGALRVRLTCCVEADSAYRVDGVRKPASGSTYELSQQVIWPVERVWVQPQSHYNDGDDWKNIPGWSDAAKTDGQDPDLDALVKRRQEALQTVRHTGRGDMRCLVFKYQPGQRIGGVRGRELKFELGGGKSESYPNVVAVTHRLHPGHQQATQVALNDEAYAPAVIGGKTGGSNG